jgi:hypothetical protein
MAKASPFAGLKLSDQTVPKGKLDQQWFGSRPPPAAEPGQHRSLPYQQAKQSHDIIDRQAGIGSRGFVQIQVGSQLRWH